MFCSWYCHAVPVQLCPRKNGIVAVGARGVEPDDHNLTVTAPTGAVLVQSRHANKIVSAGVAICDVINPVLSQVGVVCNSMIVQVFIDIKNLRLADEVVDPILQAAISVVVVVANEGAGIVDSNINCDQCYRADVIIWIGRQSGHHRFHAQQKRAPCSSVRAILTVHPQLPTHKHPLAST